MSSAARPWRSGASPRKLHSQPSLAIRSVDTIQSSFDVLPESSPSPPHLHYYPADTRARTCISLLNQTISRLRIENRQLNTPRTRQSLISEHLSAASSPNVESRSFRRLCHLDIIASKSFARHALCPLEKPLRPWVKRGVSCVERLSRLRSYHLTTIFGPNTPCSYRHGQTAFLPEQS